jgi:hypothetical protein
VSGATQAGWICFKNGCNYTLINTIQPVKHIGGTNITTATTGTLNLSSYTLPVVTAMYNIFYLNYNTGMIDLRGGGSVDPAKSNYGTGTLWVNSSTNNFSFNLEDDYYNVWFSNSAGITKFGSSAIDVYVENDIWIISGTLDLSSAGANTIHIGGDFTNDANFTASTATIRMNGSQAQYIGGSSITTFYKLTIDNSVSAGVTLNQDEIVSTLLTLTNAPLFLNSHKITITNGANTGVVRTNGYAVSETNSSVNPSIIQWNMSGTGSYVYPFGVSGTYIPFTFNKTTAGSSNISVSTRATSGSNNSPWAGASNVGSVGNMTSYYATYYNDATIPSVIDRWWDITASAAVTANLTFSYRGSENSTTAAPTGLFQAQHWNGSSWDLPVGSGTGTTSGVGTVTASAQSTFSPWVLSSSMVVLPVTLTSFTTACSGQTVVVNWETATEINNKYFTVEKSLDGHNYEIAGVVEGAGTSATNRKYVFTDSNPFSGLSYYRLRQTDVSGNSKTFTAVTSMCKESQNNICAYNNQQGSVTLSISAENNASYTATIFDAIGNKLSSKRLDAQPGLNSFSLDISSLPAGIYFVAVENGTSLIAKKIVVSN